MKISRALLHAIEAHARLGYPYEVCGVLVGRSAREIVVEDVVAVDNRERERPRVRYEIAPEDLLRVQRESRDAGRDIVGFYHSHPDHPARPSETDRRIAAEGLSDGVAHVVVGVDGQGRTTPAAWIFREGAQAFAVEPLDVSDVRQQQEEERWRSGS